MEAVIFLAADFANHESSGKLNVLGVFNRIYGRDFPVIHRRLYLVIRMLSGLGEMDTKHDLKIVFLDEDGEELGSQQGEFEIPQPKSGKQAAADIVLEVSDLYLPQPGNYEFRLVVNREVKGIIPVEVVQAESPSGQ
jgi:hypothetical protein